MCGATIFQLSSFLRRQEPSGFQRHIKLQMPRKSLGPCLRRGDEE